MSLSRDIGVWCNPVKCGIADRVVSQVESADLDGKGGRVVDFNKVIIEDTCAICEPLVDLEVPWALHGHPLVK